MSIRYFSGTEQVYNPLSMENQKVVATFGSLLGKKHDSFSRLVGFPSSADTNDRVRYVGAKPVTRVIKFKSNPSLHNCDARCSNAKGHDCECSCGGKNHGAGSST